MNHSRIAVRYAKALFLTALEKNMLDKIHSDIVVINQTVINNPNIIEALKSPVIKPSKKKILFQQIFDEFIDNLSMDFFKLVINNSREIFISDICRDFKDLYRKEKNIMNAELCTAVELKQNTIDKISNLLKEANHADINIETKVDEKLLGGFVLKLDDKLLDSSIANSLKQIQKALKSNDYQRKL